MQEVVELKFVSLRTAVTLERKTPILISLQRSDKHRWFSKPAAVAKASPANMQAVNTAIGINNFFEFINPPPMIRSSQLRTAEFHAAGHAPS